MYALRQHAQHPCPRVLALACPAFLAVADIKGNVGATRDEVRALLAAGASANARGKASERSSPQLALHLAIPWEYCEEEQEDAAIQIIDILLTAGAEIDAREDGYDRNTTVMTAAWNKRSRIVKRLIERGANTGLRNRDGQTVFGATYKRSQSNSGIEEIMRVVAEHTADGQAWLGSTEGKEWLRNQEVDPGATLGVSPAGAWGDL
jgi:hypothetical protein